MTDAAAARKRSEMLKELRQQHQATVERTQALLRDQKKIHQAICKALEEEERTAPQIAELLELSPTEALWHLTALKRYNIIAESEMNGEYFLYKLADQEAG
ncbi:MAG: winged helix-turn-helix domain-containing protein [Anaerolineales bacterium]|jgi:predicted transcriptional regulator